MAAPRMGIVYCGTIKMNARMTGMANNLTKLTEATARTTGRRYCSTHGSEVSFDAGSYVLRNKATRWVCFECQKRRSLTLPATCLKRKE